MNQRDGYSFVVIFLISVTKRAGQMDRPAVEVQSIENCDKQNDYVLQVTKTDETYVCFLIDHNEIVILIFDLMC